MMYDFIKGGSLILATISMGLVTGAFWLYANTIMPGLGKTDDRTFVGAFQAIDRSIMNPWFIGFGFMGALVFTGLAAGLHFREDGRPVLPWLIAAFVLYLIGFIITVAVNVPLNDAIKAAGDPATIDVAAVRAAFDEAKWIGWNLVRTVTSTASFGALVWSLVLYGRNT